MGSEQLWIDGQDLNGIVVEKREIGRPNGKPLIPMDRHLPETSQTAVIHTTEGSSIDGALTTLSSKFSPSHFVAGQNRIVQCRPVGVQAASLHAPENAYADIQIECVGYSKTYPWLFFEPTLHPLVCLLAWAVPALGIPLVRPNPNWKDDMSDCPLPWATNNARRKDGAWDAHVSGFYGHIEVSNQGPTWHYDPGCLKWADLFAAVQAQIDFNNSHSSMKD